MTPVRLREKTISTQCGVNAGETSEGVADNHTGGKLDTGADNQRIRGGK